jgi:hypothetical protein
MYCTINRNFFYCVFWTNTSAGAYNAEFYNEANDLILMRIQQTATGAGGRTSVNGSLIVFFCNQRCVISVRRVNASSGIIEMGVLTEALQLTTWGGILIYYF